MKRKKEAGELWQLFCQTGDPLHYTLYRRKKAEENLSPATRKRG